METKAYSQNREEQVILDYFGDFAGKLCDIGANNGWELSNSKALIERGWAGVCVEPSPGAYAALCETHKDNQEVICVHAAIGTEEGMITLHDCADSLLSTIVAEHKDIFPNHDYKEEQVPCLTWKNLLLFHPGPYHMITIDAEGMDWAILQQIDLTDVQLICVEFGGAEIEKYIRYCSEYGMKVLYTSPQNLIMGK